MTTFSAGGGGPFGRTLTKLSDGTTDAANVVAEITKMANTPGDDDKAGAKGANITENGRFQVIKLVAGANLLGAAGKANDYIEFIEILGGMTVAGAPASAGKIQIRNAAAVVIKEFDLQTVKTDLPPYFKWDVNLITTDKWDVYLQTSVNAATGGKLYVTGRFSDA